MLQYSKHFLQHIFFIIFFLFKFRIFSPIFFCNLNFLIPKSSSPSHFLHNQQKTQLSLCFSSIFYISLPIIKNKKKQKLYNFYMKKINFIFPMTMWVAEQENEIFCVWKIFCFFLFQILDRFWRDFLSPPPCLFLFISYISSKLK